MRLEAKRGGTRADTLADASWGLQGSHLLCSHHFLMQTLGDIGETFRADSTTGTETPEWIANENVERCFSQ